MESTDAASRRSPPTKIPLTGGASKCEAHPSVAFLAGRTCLCCCFHARGRDTASSRGGGLSSSAGFHVRLPCLNLIQCFTIPSSSIFSIETSPQHHSFPCLCNDCQLWEIHRVVCKELSVYTSRNSTKLIFADIIQIYGDEKPSTDD